MSDREKLIELLKKAKQAFWMDRFNCDFFGFVADHLIANGVTIRKKSQKVKPRKRKHNAITNETFLALEKIGQQTHKGE